jgi:hypothetical protein
MSKIDAAHERRGKNPEDFSTKSDFTSENAAKNNFRRA